MIKQIKKINTTNQKFVYIDKGSEFKAGDYVLITKINANKKRKSKGENENIFQKKKKKK